MTQPTFELTDRTPTAATALLRDDNTGWVYIAGLELRGEHDWYANDTWTHHLPGYPDAPQAHR